MKKYFGFLFATLFASVLTAQQPQSQLAPITALNAKYANGVSPGYWATAGSGLTLNVSGGTVFCAGSVVTYSAGTLTMTASTTNYVYLNTASSCVPAVKTTAFTSSDIPVAQVVTSGSAITGITDVRTPFNNSAAGASSPLTTKGDLYGFSTTNVRIPVGSDGKVLTADSTVAAGESWQTPSSGGGIPYIATTGSVNVMVATFSPAITSLTTGLAILINPNISTTSTSPTVNVNGLGARTITSKSIFPVAVGSLNSGRPVLLVYNGTTFDLQDSTVEILAAANGSTSAPSISFFNSPGSGFSWGGYIGINVGGVEVGAFGGGASFISEGDLIVKSGGHLLDQELTAGTCLDAVSATFGPKIASTSADCVVQSAFSTLTDASTVTWAVGSLYIANAKLTFTVHSGSRTLNLTGLVNGGHYVLSVIQDATGGEGLILGTGCTWKVSGGGAGAITPSVGASAIDVLDFHYDGTNCYAVFTKNFN